MRLMRCLCIASILSSGVVCAAPTIPEVTDVKDMLIRAIDTDQELTAWLVGSLANKIKSDTKAPSGTKVKASVRTLSLIRPGCKRLHLEFSEPEHLMLTKNGTKEPFVIWYDLNICRDGKPPAISKIGTVE